MSFNVNGDYKITGSVVNAIKDTGLESNKQSVLPTISSDQSEYLQCSPYWDGNNWAISNEKISIGLNAGAISQAARGLAIGYYAGYANQDIYTTAIGNQAGQENQGENAIAIGVNAGYYNQGDASIAIGIDAGNTGQGANSVAIGTGAGYHNQGIGSIAIGTEASRTNHGAGAVSIGLNAGDESQGGSQAICIGAYSGYVDSSDNCICLNAQGVPLTDVLSNSFHVAPIRINNSGTDKALLYNRTTKEIYADAVKTFVIQHPQKDDSYLVHSCLEGPEVGVYYRGEGTVSESLESEVSIPEYTEKFMEFSVVVSPIYNGELVRMVVGKLCDGKFKVRADKKCDFNWLCLGSRGKIDVEPKKSEVELKGDGPYKYL